jgi:hypothetical protein
MTWDKVPWSPQRTKCFGCAQICPVCLGVPVRAIVTEIPVGRSGGPRPAAVTRMIRFLICHGHHARRSSPATGRSALVPERTTNRSSKGTNLRMRHQSPTKKKDGLSGPPTSGSRGAVDSLGALVDGKLNETGVVEFTKQRRALTLL